MSTNKELNKEQLEKIKGGTRPEDIGDPVMLPGAIESYRVCPKCGACMFPQTIVQTQGKTKHPQKPNYNCSECDYVEENIRVF